MQLTQYICINDLTCKLWLGDIPLSKIYNDGQMDRQTNVHMMTIPLGQGVKMVHDKVFLNFLANRPFSTQKWWHHQNKL